MNQPKYKSTAQLQQEWFEAGCPINHSGGAACAFNPAPWQNNPFCQPNLHLRMQGLVDERKGED
jgi:hypothetical protein